MVSAAHAMLNDQFAAAMDRLGPFEPHPRVAVAVSGGADSMALALLTHAWVQARHGEVQALTVDHGLRAASAAEADVTLTRLAVLGIQGRKLTVCGLARGPGLAERARIARYQLLLDECRAAGIPHLLLGHHRGDQVETVMMRALSGSASRGLAAMPALTEGRFVRLLRPLLMIRRGLLRAFLSDHGMAWVEDPSNGDPAALRSRLRITRADPAGDSDATLAVANAARQAGWQRAAQDRAIAETLAQRATIRPEGYAVLTPGVIDPEPLATLLRTIGGAFHKLSIDRVAALARALRPATLGGVRILPAGHLGPGWLLVREMRAVSVPVRAVRDAVWDGRFRLIAAPPAPLDRAGTEPTLGALGTDAVRFRSRDGLPAAVLRGLPALRQDGALLAVPHLGVGDRRWQLLFDPRNCAAGAPFLPAC